MRFDQNMTVRAAGPGQIALKPDVDIPWNFRVSHL
jgi:hypothetical protein